MYNEEAEKRIKKRVKAKKAFLTHLSVYISVGIFFLLIDLVTRSGGDDLWFFFPMIPWGMGLMIHYFISFGLPGSEELISRWELEEAARELKQTKSNTPKSLESGQQEDQLELREIEREASARYEDRDLV